MSCPRCGSTDPAVRNVPPMCDGSCADSWHDRPTPAPDDLSVHLSDIPVEEADALVRFAAVMTVGGIDYPSCPTCGSVNPGIRRGYCPDRFH